MIRVIEFRAFVFIFLQFLFFQISFSQADYLPGTIINLKKDTLQGFIDYRNWSNSPNKIYFMRQNDSVKSCYTPTDIIEFRVKDEVYISAIVQTEASSSNSYYLQETPILNFEIDTAFLQTLFEGEKGLYYYKNSYGKENFYIKQDKGFELLVHKKYYKTFDRKYVRAQNRAYLGQLTLYLDDCPEINSTIKNTEYSRKSLVKLFQEYYKASKKEALYQKKEEKLKVEKGIIAGLSLSYIEFSGEGLPYLQLSDYKQSLNIAAGFYFDIHLPRNKGKWSINSEFLFTSYKLTGYAEYYEGDNTYSFVDTEIGYSYLKMNNLLRYNYPIRSVNIYINAGISNGIAIQEKNVKNKITKFFTTVNTDNGKAIDKTRDYEQSYVVGLGSKYKNFSVEMRYERGNGMSSYSSLTSITGRYYVLFGYRF